MIESFLAKIFVLILKKSSAIVVSRLAISAIEIYSTFQAVMGLVDCIESVNDCQELSVCGLKVVSPPMTETIVNQLIKVGNTTFDVRRTESGIYLASSLVPEFALSHLDFPAIVKKRFPRFVQADFPKLKRD